jgi:hypothetical protein
LRGAAPRLNGKNCAQKHHRKAILRKKPEIFADAFDSIKPKIIFVWRNFIRIHGARNKPINSVIQVFFYRKTINNIRLTSGHAKAAKKNEGANTFPSQPSRSSRDTFPFFLLWQIAKV